MTEDKKQELTQVLQEALANLEIRCAWAKGISYLTVSDYRNHLLQRWDYSGPSVLNFTPHIVREDTKSKLLDFIRAELSGYIHEDMIQSACFFIKIGGQIPGYHLSYLLYQLMRITIVRGVENAVLAFDRCTTETHGSFQYLAILEGIKLESEIHIYAGIQLIPLPENKSQLPRYLLNHMFRGDEDKFTGRTLLIIDCSVFPMFCKPVPIPNQDSSSQAFQECLSRFRIEVGNSTFPNFDVDIFYNKFCQALSLVCNSNVQISRHWPFLAEDKLFNLESMGVSRTQYPSHPPFGMPNPLSSLQIDEVKHLYELLVNRDSGILKKLKIPIDRWQKSKRDRDPVDKMIDLGIGFESLYLQDTRDELTFKLGVRASWYLGKDKGHRKKLLAEFKEIYKCRSTGVHDGKLKSSVTIEGKSVPISEFIERSQDLCRNSIIKILEDGKFPDDWNNVILGEDSL